MWSLAAYKLRRKNGDRHLFDLVLASRSNVLKILLSIFTHLIKCRNEPLLNKVVSINSQLDYLVMQNSK